MRDGLECIEKMGLSFVKSVEQFYSWHCAGLGDGRICSKIEHCLGNDEWWRKFYKGYVLYALPGLFDHCPLVVKMSHGNIRGGRPFRVFNYMVEHPRFMEVVEKE